MIKATYDTNVLVSGTVSLQGPPAFVRSHLLLNCQRRWKKAYFTSRLTNKQTQSFIHLVRERATIVSITAPMPQVATHSEDDIVLATAESGKAKYIVTGDYGLQDLKQYNDIQIVSPQAFSVILQSKTL